MTWNSVVNAMSTPAFALGYIMGVWVTIAIGIIFDRPHKSARGVEK